MCCDVNPVFGQLLATENFSAHRTRPGSSSARVAHNTKGRGRLSRLHTHVCFLESTAHYVEPFSYSTFFLLLFSVFQCTGPYFIVVTALAFFFLISFFIFNDNNRPPPTPPPPPRTLCSLALLHASCVSASLKNLTGCMSRCRLSPRRTLRGSGCQIIWNKIHSERRYA